MKPTVLGIFFVLLTQTAIAQEVASCRNPEGYAYFHYAGLAKKDDYGWAKDKISNGRISLFKSGKQVDILYTDTRSKPISSAADGGQVILLGASEESATVLVAYAGSIEVYTFFQENDGKSRFTMFQSKTSDSAIIPKSGLMLGECERFDFSILKSIK